MFRGELTVGPVLVVSAPAFSFAEEGCAAELLGAAEEGAGLRGWERLGAVLVALGWVLLCSSAERSLGSTAAELVGSLEGVLVAVLSAGASVVLLGTGSTSPLVGV